MEPEKIPQMIKDEYDDLIKDNVMSRISFMGDDYPKIKPFIYYFDGEFIYFLATKYGEKLEYIKNNPKVTVEIEEYEPDLSNYKFVTLSGRLKIVEDEEEKNRVRKGFADMIEERDLSRNIMKAIGYSPDDPLEKIMEEDRNLVLKIVNVENITGLKNG